MEFFNLDSPEDVDSSNYDEIEALDIQQFHQRFVDQLFQESENTSNDETDEHIFVASFTTHLAGPSASLTFSEQQNIKDMIQFSF